MPPTRRDLLIGAGMGLLAAGRPASAVARRRPEPLALARARARAVERPRGLIYNTDQDAMGAPGAGTVRGFVAARYDPLIDTQVAAIDDCAGNTMLATFRSRIAERYEDRGERCAADTTCAAWRDNMRALTAAGHDRVRLVNAFCRRHRLEHVFSHRVNDVHDAFADWELAELKRARPDLLLGRPGVTSDPDDPRAYWSALDFAKPEVRGFTRRLLADVEARYDVDGVELDFLRSTLLFAEHLRLEPATERHVALLTRMMRSIRADAYRLGTRRARPILVAVRVPATVAACRTVGIDIERWLREGLVDLVRLAGGYMPFTEPVAPLIALAHRHDVPAHVTISNSGLRGRLSALEAWRGAATNAWATGADGIMTFNLFPPGRDRRLLEIGSPRTLAGRAKVFAIEPEPVLQAQTRLGTVQKDILPVAVPARRRLPVGDRLARLRRARLLVRADDPRALALRLNGAELAPASGPDDEGWTEYLPPRRALRSGDNALDLLPVGAGARTRVTGVELHVTFD